MRTFCLAYELQRFAVARRFVQEHRQYNIEEGMIGATIMLSPRYFDALTFLFEPRIEYRTVRSINPPQVGRGTFVFIDLEDVHGRFVVQRSQ